MARGGRTLYLGFSGLLETDSLQFQSGTDAGRPDCERFLLF